MTSHSNRKPSRQEKASMGCCLVAIVLIALAVVYWSKIKVLPWYWQMSLVLLGVFILTGILAAGKSPQQRQIAYPEALFRAEKHREALREVEKLLEKNPANDEAWYLKGQCLDRLGRTEEADAAWKETLRLNPGHCRAAHDLACDYLDRQDFLAAAKYFAAARDHGAAAVEPVTFGANIEKLKKSLHWTCYELQKKREYEQALRYADAILSVDPDDVDGHLRKSRCHQVLGQTDKAIQSAQACLKLDRDNKQAQQLLSLAQRQATRMPGQTGSSSKGRDSLLPQASANAMAAERHITLGMLAPAAANLIRLATSVAKECGNRCVEPEHLFIGLCRLATFVAPSSAPDVLAAQQLLARSGVRPQVLELATARAMATAKDMVGPFTGRLSAGCKNLILDARERAKERSSTHIMPEDLLACLFASLDSRPVLAMTLRRTGANLRGIRRPAGLVTSGQLVSADASAGPWYVGQQIADSYQITGVLGKGGMGIVYKARDLATGRDVAIKVALRSEGTDLSESQRLAREAERWVTLVHPYIVRADRVIENPTTGFRLAVVMEYCDGGSLASRIRRPPDLPLADALDIGIQVCWAMTYAHSKELIHHDLKPSNVLLGHDGHASVSDFGLSRPLRQDKLGHPTPSEVGSIKPVLDAASRGDVRGTYPYMAPEVWEGKSTLASDVYAFGVMLFEICCRRRPFEASTPAGWYQVHRRERAPDLKVANPGIPPLLGQLIADCLDKVPERRPTFKEVGDRLSTCYRELTGQPHAERRQLTQILITAREKQAQALNLLRDASVSRLRGLPEDAHRQIRKAQGLFSAIGDDLGQASCLNNIGNIHREQGRPREAADFHRKCLDILRRKGEWTEIPGCLDNLASDMSNADDWSAAIQHYLESIRIRQEHNDWVGLAICHVNLGMTYWESGQKDMAEQTFQKAIEYGTRAEGNGIEAVAGANLGLGNVRLDQNRLGEAERCYQQGLDLAKQRGKPGLVAKCTISMGAVQARRGEYAQAGAAYEKGLALLDEIGDRPAYARGCHELGLIHTASHRWDKAKLACEKALAVYRRLADARKTAECLGDLAIICDHMSDHDGARSYATESAGLHKRLGLPVPQEVEQLLAPIRASVATSEGKGPYESAHKCYEQGRHEEAEGHFREALAAFRREGNQHMEADCLFNLGSLAVQRNDPSTARRLLTQVLSIVQRTGQLDLLSGCHTLLAGLAAGAGDQGKAIELFELALKYAEKCPSRQTEGVCCFNLGIACQEAKQLDKAESCYRRGVNLAERVNDLETAAKCLGQLAQVAGTRGDATTMRDYARQSIQICWRIGLPVPPGLAEAAGE